MLTIIGASGRTGRAITASLLDQGITPHVLVRREDAAAAWRARGATASLVDLADQTALTRALIGTTALFAIVPEDPAAPDVEPHRRRLGDVLAAGVRTARVPHVVFLSAVATTGPARALRHAEGALAATGCTLTVLRAPYFQENLAAAVPVARERGVVANLLPTADLALPMIAIDDVAAQAVAWLRHPPARSQVVHFAAPRYTMTTVAALLGDALGRGLDVVTVPPANQRAFLAGAGLPPGFAAALVELHAELATLAGQPDPPGAAPAPTPLAATLESLVAVPAPLAIGAVLDELTAAWNRHDLAAMGALYRADADFVNIFGGHLRGRDEIVREHELRHRGMFARAVMTAAAPELRMLRPDLAVARVAWTMRGITGPDGAPAGERTGLMVHVLERRAGAWAIVTTQNTELAADAPRRFLDQRAG